MTDLRAIRRLAHSTLRNYQLSIKLFCHYITDRAYAWPAECEERLSWTWGEHVRPGQDSPKGRVALTWVVHWHSRWMQKIRSRRETWRAGAGVSGGDGAGAAPAEAKREQCIAVPLVEAVHSSGEALTLRHTATIGGIDCCVLLPGPYPSRISCGMPLTSPFGEHHRQDPDRPELDWGYANDERSATIRAVGLVPIDTTIPLGDELLTFDRAVGRWKHLLRDWLSVIINGPTDFLVPEWGETIWGSAKHDRELLHAKDDTGELRWPESVSGWQWRHSLQHAGSGDQPSLARKLLTTATRAQATGDWRLAVIDAATAAEVALTTGLTARLTTEASPRVVQVLIERTRMLGPRLDLARDLGMTIPSGIQADLVKHRNAVVHRGTEVTRSDARSAIAAAHKIVDEYEPLTVHCQEPFDDEDPPSHE
jgi:hypothetical protein